MLGDMVSIYLISETDKLFSQVVVSFYTLLNSI